MNPQELNILHLTTALRTQMTDSLTDADLAFKFPNNPTLGELCKSMGDVEQMYIDSFKTFKHDFSYKKDDAALATSVERLKAWYKVLDEELDAALMAIPDSDFQTKTVDRGGGFMMPLGGQFHTYREAILISCGKADVYLRAMDKPLAQQWRGWIDRMTTITKLDLKKDLKHLYNPSPKAVEIVDVPEMCFLMIDGAGDPNTASEYKEAVGALYSVAYTLKFAIKKGENVDYPVMALEGLWWVEDLTQFSYTERSNWRWTMMIMQPEIVTDAAFQQALEQVRKKKNPPLLERMRFETYHEGLAAQIMHIGPYADEMPTVARLHDTIVEKGYQLRGKHHEIYLGDPNRSAPEKLKTILRQPIALTG